MAIFFPKETWIENPYSIVLSIILLHFWMVIYETTHTTEVAMQPVLDWFKNMW